MASRTKRTNEVNREDGSEATAVLGDQLVALARQGARQMLTEALHEEVESYLQRGRYRRCEDEETFRGYRNGTSPRSGSDIRFQDSMPGQAGRRLAHAGRSR